MCDIIVNVGTRRQMVDAFAKPFLVHPYCGVHATVLFPSSLCQSNGNIGRSSDLTGLICLAKLPYEMEPLSNQSKNLLNVRRK